MKPHRDKLERTKNWPLQIAEDRADYVLATEILHRGGPTYTLEEVAQRSGLDKYHLKYRTKRLQKKHRLK